MQSGGREGQWKFHECHYGSVEFSHSICERGISFGQLMQSLCEWSWVLSVTRGCVLYESTAEEKGKCISKQENKMSAKPNGKVFRKCLHEFMCCNVSFLQCSPSKHCLFWKRQIGPMILSHSPKSLHNPFKWCSFSSTLCRWYIAACCHHQFQTLVLFNMCRGMDTILKNMVHPQHVLKQVHKVNMWVP